MFETRNKLTAKIAALETENTELRDEITDLTAKVEEFSNASEMVAGLNNQIETLTGEVATAKADLETAKAEFSVKETNLANELAAEKAKTTPEAINLLVANEIAKAGIAPIEGIDNSTNAVESTSPQLTGLAKTLAAFKKEFAKK